MPKTPTYRIRAGYAQALVTLTDARTKKRRDYWLGPAHSPQSREKYHIVIAAWEANGRCFPDPTDPTDPISTHTRDAALTPDVQTLTVVELMRAYWVWAKRYYRPNECHTLRIALRLLKKFYGTTAVAEFGPMKLRVLRESMIRGDAMAMPPRKPWTRGFINHQCRRIRQMFKWAASHELADASIYQALCTLEPLKRGRTDALEGRTVTPIGLDRVDAIRPFVSRQVAALIDLQLLTGSRGGELVKLRSVDIDRSRPDGVWVYAPKEHKNMHRGKTREILFGPAAQRILSPFMAERSVHAYLFSPSEAESERRAELHAHRKTPLSCGNRPGSNKRAEPVRTVGDHYTAPSSHIPHCNPGPLLVRSQSLPSAGRALRIAPINHPPTTEAINASRRLLKS